MNLASIAAGAVWEAPPVVARHGARDDGRRIVAALLCHWPESEAKNRPVARNASALALGSRFPECFELGLERIDTP